MKHYFDNSGLSFALAKLGLSFTGGQQEDTEVVATLESNIIFEDDLMANVYIDDPELEVKSFKYSCEGFESSSIPNDNEDSSYILNLDLSSCEVNPNTSTIGLKLTLFDSNTPISFAPIILVRGEIKIYK